MSGATVVRLRTTVLSVPLHTPFVTALRRTSTIDTVVVEITDSDGRTGWGEAPQAWRVTGESLAGARACLDGPLSDVLVGAPADPRASTGLVARAVVGNAGAKAAADVALHDLAARTSGVTLAEHLAAYAGVGGSGGSGGSGGAGGVVPGAARGVVPTDVTLAAGSVEGLAEAARARVAEGFTVLKLKVGTDAATDVDRVRAVRDAVGPEVALRLDANQGWDAVAAVRAVRAMEDAGLGVALVEQPVPARDVEGLAHVTAHVATPVMADESLLDLHDLVSLLRLGAVDLVNVKLAKCGGLTPALELLDVAARHGLGTMVGSMMESHVGVGAAAALVAGVGTTCSADLDAAWWATVSPYDGGIGYDGGAVLLPAEPGLGVRGLAGGRP